MKEFRLTGLCAATVTPFDDQGNLRLEQVNRIVDQLVVSGVSGLYVCGSTGEGVSLTDAERMEVAAAYVEAADQRVPVMVQVGQNSLTGARKLAAHAESIGADGISATCPSYFRIDRLEILVDSMADVAAGAPKLPFYYYHIPVLTGVDLKMVEFLRLASDRIPNLYGLKFTAPTLHEYQHCLELDNGRFDIQWGVDEMLLGALATGSKGAVGSTYNIAAPLYRRIIDAFGHNDLREARHWQSRANAFIRILTSFPFHSALREVLKLQGLDCGRSRLPQRALTVAEAAELKKELDTIAFFEWCQATEDQSRLFSESATNGHQIQSTASSTRRHERI